MSKKDKGAPVVLVGQREALYVEDAEAAVPYRGSQLFPRVKFLPPEFNLEEIEKLVSERITVVSNFSCTFDEQVAEWKSLRDLHAAQSTVTEGEEETEQAPPPLVMKKIVMEEATEEESTEGEEGKTKVAEGESLPRVLSEDVCDDLLGVLNAFNAVIDWKSVSKSTETSQGNNVVGDQELWQAIYPQNEGGIPIVSDDGIYVVRLFWHGAWRSLVIDDSVPVDADNNVLLLKSTEKNEIWPCILSKAILWLYQGMQYTTSLDSSAVALIRALTGSLSYETSYEWDETTWKYLSDIFETKIVTSENSTSSSSTTDEEHEETEEGETATEGGGAESSDANPDANGEDIPEPKVFGDHGIVAQCTLSKKKATIVHLKPDYMYAITKLMVDERMNGERSIGIWNPKSGETMWLKWKKFRQFFAGARQLEIEATHAHSFTTLSEKLNFIEKNSDEGEETTVMFESVSNDFSDNRVAITNSSENDQRVHIDFTAFLLENDFAAAAGDVRTFLHIAEDGEKDGGKVLKTMMTSASSGGFASSFINVKPGTTYLDLDLDSPCGATIHLSSDHCDIEMTNLQNYLNSEQNMISTIGNLRDTEPGHKIVFLTQKFKFVKNEEENQESKEKPSNHDLSIHFSLKNSVLENLISLTVIDHDTQTKHEFPCLSNWHWQCPESSSGYSILGFVDTKLVKEAIVGSEWKLILSSTTDSFENLNPDTAAEVDDSNATTTTNYFSNMDPKLHQVFEGKYIPNKYMRIFRDVLTLDPDVEETTVDLISFRLVCSDPSLKINLQVEVEKSISENEDSADPSGPNAENEGKEANKYSTEVLRRASGEGKNGTFLMLLPVPAGGSRIILDAFIDVSECHVEENLISRRPFHYLRDDIDNAEKSYSNIAWSLHVFSSNKVVISRDTRKEVSQRKLIDSWEENQPGRKELSTETRSRNIGGGDDGTENEEKSKEASTEGEERSIEEGNTTIEPEVHFVNEGEEEKGGDPEAAVSTEIAEQKTFDDLEAKIESESKVFTEIIEKRDRLLKSREESSKVFWAGNVALPKREQMIEKLHSLKQNE
eukprot:g1743.t1